MIEISLILSELRTKSPAYQDMSKKLHTLDIIRAIGKYYCYFEIHREKTSWSRGLVKSRQKNGRDSRSRETEVGEKIADSVYRKMNYLMMEQCSN